MGDTRERHDDPTPPRRPYVTPVLRRFGDLAKLTQAVARTSTLSDGGTGSMSKTH